MGTFSGDTKSRVGNLCIGKETMGTPAHRVLTVPLLLCLIIFPHVSSTHSPLSPVQLVYFIGCQVTVMIYFNSWDNSGIPLKSTCLKSSFTSDTLFK